MRIAALRRQAKKAFRRGLLWADPFKRANLRTVSEYTVLKMIRQTNTVYFLQTPDGPRYFRVLDGRGEALASICRSFGTEQLGKLLEVSYLHPESELVSVPGLGYGILQMPAGGVNIMPYTGSQRRQMLTGTFQRAINDLNLLDTLCFETDHSPNNYNVTLDAAGKLDGLRVFDNNGRGVFACRRQVRFLTYKKLSFFVTEDGLIHRPHLSRKTAEALERLNLRRVFKAMRRCLKPLPILFLYSRISAVRRAVRKSARLNPAFLLDLQAWNEETIREELNGSYGKTYLSGFLQDCVPPES